MALAPSTIKVHMDVALGSYVVYPISGTNSYEVHIKPRVGAVMSRKYKYVNVVERKEDYGGDVNTYEGNTTYGGFSTQFPNSGCPLRLYCSGSSLNSTKSITWDIYIYGTIQREFPHQIKPHNAAEWDYFYRMAKDDSSADDSNMEVYWSLNRLTDRNFRGVLFLDDSKSPSNWFNSTLETNAQLSQKRDNITYTKCIALYDYDYTYLPISHDGKLLRGVRNGNTVILRDC